METRETAAPKSRSGQKSSKVGVVMSSAMDKTVVVKVERRILHEMYHRFVKRSSKFMAHDAENSCGVGDKVEIRETRPLSRRKRWRVTAVLVKAK